MKQIDDSGETPIEVGAYLALVLLVMAFLMTTIGAILDAFNAQALSWSLTTTWAQVEMATYLGYIKWAYRIPAIFIIIVLIWGVRAVIRKHTYTTETGQQYMNPEDEFQ